MKADVNHVEIRPQVHDRPEDVRNGVELGRRALQKVETALDSRLEDFVGDDRIHVPGLPRPPWFPRGRS